MRKIRVIPDRSRVSLRDNKFTSRDARKLPTQQLKTRSPGSDLSIHSFFQLGRSDVEEDETLRELDAGMWRRFAECRWCSICANRTCGPATRSGGGHRLEHSPHQFRDRIAGPNGHARGHREIGPYQRRRTPSDAFGRQPGFRADELWRRLRFRCLRHLAARPRRSIHAGVDQRPPHCAVRPGRRRPEGLCRLEPHPAGSGRSCGNPEGWRVCHLRVGRDRRRSERDLAQEFSGRGRERELRPVALSRREGDARCDHRRIR